MSFFPFQIGFFWYLHNLNTTKMFFVSTMQKDLKKREFKNLYLESSWIRQTSYFEDHFHFRTKREREREETEREGRRERDREGENDKQAERERQTEKQKERDWHVYKHNVTKILGPKIKILDPKNPGSQNPGSKKSPGSKKCPRSAPDFSLRVFNLTNTASASRPCVSVSFGEPELGCVVFVLCSLS